MMRLRNDYLWDLKPRNARATNRKILFVRLQSRVVSSGKAISQFSALLVLFAVFFLHTGCGFTYKGYYGAELTDDDVVSLVFPLPALTTLAGVNDMGPSHPIRIRTLYLRPGLNVIKLGCTAPYDVVLAVTDPETGYVLKREFSLEKLTHAMGKYRTITSTFEAGREYWLVSDFPKELNPGAELPTEIKPGEYVVDWVTEILTSTGKRIDVKVSDDALITADMYPSIQQFGLRKTPTANDDRDSAGSEEERDQ